MHLQSNDEEIESNPVFLRKQMQSKPSFETNSSNNKFRHKEISVNGSVLPKTNSYNLSAINLLNSRGSLTYSHTIPVRADVHQQIPGHQNHIQTSANGLNSTENKESEKMTAIKGILKTKPTECLAGNGVIRHDNQSVSNLSQHKTQNQDLISANMKNSVSVSTPTPSPRRKSSSVQFDSHIHDIKESKRVDFNTNPRGLTSISSARRESSNSSSSLSIIQSTIATNPVLTYDFPKTSQKMSDLRKILNPEIEKEDSLKKLGERLIHCDCFELNLNNAAKIISGLVLLATLILVLRALYNVF